MLHVIGKIKSCSGRISPFTLSSSPTPESFTPIIKHFTPSPSNPSNSYAEIPNQHSFTVLCSELKTPNSVIAFFENHNFSDTQISTIVKKWPSVFNHDPNSRFRSKIILFRNLGLSSSEIVKVLTMAPYLLERNLQNIVEIVCFLQGLLRSDRDVVLSIMRYPFILDANLEHTLLHNVGLLRFAGVPEHHIVFLLKSTPGKLAVKPENFKVMVERLQQLGLKPYRRNFVVGLTVMRQMSCATWEEKIRCYNRFGWSEHEVLDAFRKHPRFMSASVDKITRALHLLVDQMGCDLDFIIKRPQILTLSFERILMPRCAFYHVILSKGLVEEGCLLEMMNCLQSFSIDKFLVSYAERDPQLLRLYIGKFLAARKSIALAES